MGYEAIGIEKMLAVPVDHVDLRIASRSDQNDGPHLMSVNLWMGNRLQSDFV